MTEGIKTIIYPVKHLARARALYRELLGVEPIASVKDADGNVIGLIQSA